MTTEIMLTEQQSAVIDTKETVERLEHVMAEVGQFKAFDFLQKLLTVANLNSIKKIKENKEYKGLTYRDENEKLLTVSNFDEFCTYKLGVSRATIDNNLLNLTAFGEEFFEASKKIGLGVRELRKLRQLPNEQQLAVINSEEVDLADKSAVKELIEDLVLQHNQEKKELKAELKDSQQSLKASRDNAAEKQSQLDLMKEDEAKRRYSQQAWQRQTLDNINGLIEGRLSVVSGLNQITDIFQGLTEDEDNKDQKAIDNIARSLLTEIQHASVLLETLKSNAFGLLGGSYSADLSADELLEQLALNQDQLLEE